MPTVLITGSNRALGLEWAHQYAQAGWVVHATCRRPAEARALLALAEGHPRLQVHRLDVTRPDEVNAVAVALRGQPVDLLINNAGVYLEKYTESRLGSLRYDDWLDTLRVNTLGAVRVTEALVDSLAAGSMRLVVAITSHMGSIAEIEAPGSYYYRSSKAALNAAMKGLTADLGERGIGVLLLHPGWVRSRMGGPDARLTPAESVSAMRERIAVFDRRASGRFLRYDGSEIPW